MSVSLELIKQLRESTSLGISDCRRALEDSQGDMNKAKDILKKKALDMAEKNLTARPRRERSLLISILTARSGYWRR